MSFSIFLTRLASMLLCLLLIGQAQAAELKLRILQTTDLHMNLLNHDYFQDKSTDEFGLAKTITLIHAARDESPNNLLFDNGDLLQGNPLGDMMARVKPRVQGEIHPAYKVLNLLRVDAANLGNHEFNYGLDFLHQSLKGANFPYVNANVMKAAAPGAKSVHAFTPYVMLERSFVDDAGQPQTLKIGVIGFAPPQIMQWDRANLQGLVTVRDIVQSAQELLPKMRAKGAQLVVAIAHTGFEKNPQGRFAENAAAELAQLPGIDALLLGHAHAEFPGPAFADYPGVDMKRGSIYGVPTVMPGRWGDHLGVIDLHLSRTNGRWRVTDSHTELRAIYQRSPPRTLVATDPMVAHVIASEHADTLNHLRAQVATTLAPIHSYFAQVMASASVRLVAQAQLAYMARAVQGTAYENLPILSAAAPFKAGGRQGWSQYTDIPAGPLAIKHVADLYVYPNTIQAVKIIGAQVREWLEMSAGQFFRIDPAGAPEQELLDPDFRAYNFDSIEGVSYDIDVTQAARYSAEGRPTGKAGHRIVNLRYQGKAIDEEMQFLVVTNNYRANGGGNFPDLNADKIVVDAPAQTREALTQYLTNLGQFKPAARANWRILPVPGIKLRFSSGVGALPHLPATPQVQLLRQGGEGSALFELNP